MWLFLASSVTKNTAVMPVPSSTTYSRRLSQRKQLALEVLLDGQVEADDAEHDPDDRDQEAERGQQAAPEPAS
jgi:hypothetical protein